MRWLQVLLALQLAFTLVVGRRQVLAALSVPRPDSVFDLVSPFRFLDRDWGIAVAVTVLLVAALGFMPRLFVPLQFWLTAGFSVSCVSLADGGDAIAGLLLFELLPWAVDPKPRTVMLSRWAVRIQMALIYLSAGVTKLEVPAWRQGTALHSYASDNVDGLLYASWLHALDQTVVLHFLTWATPLAEVGLAAALFAGPRYRRLALVVGASLHVFIGLGFGLYTFQLVMVGGLLVLTEPWRGMESAEAGGHRLDHERYVGG